MNNAEKLLPFTDYTFLAEPHEQEKYNAYIEQATKNDVACLCVYPRYINSLSQLLPNKRLATVINFPQGDDNIESIKSDLKIAQNAHELDIVFPYQDFLLNNKEYAFEKMQQILKLIPSSKIIKVIIESGIYANQEQIKQVCDFLITLPIHFIKTSTGKIEHGASLDAAKIILNCIKNTNIGLKVSGGVRTIKQATNYLSLAEKYLTQPLSNKNFRIGASKIFSV